MGIMRRGVSSGIKFNADTDYVRIKDKFKNAWKDWQQTGLVIKPSVITVTTGSLTGQPVTCQIGEESYTTTFIEGVAVFKVFSAGTALISCNGFEVEVKVEDTGGGNYTAQLEEVLELVLWENEGAQNGAKDNTQDLTFTTSAGFFRNRTLKFTMKNNIQYRMYISLSNGGSYCNFFVDNNGPVMGSGASDFKVGETYSFTYDQVIALAADKKNIIDNANYIKIAMYDYNAQSYYAMHTRCSKIWLE